MELTVTPKANNRSWEKLNIRPRDHARFKILAAQYHIEMAELFSRCVDALERDYQERHQENDRQ